MIYISVLTMHMNVRVFFLLKLKFFNKKGVKESGFLLAPRNCTLISWLCICSAWRSKQEKFQDKKLYFVVRKPPQADLEVLGALCAGAVVFIIFAYNKELPKCHAVADAVSKLHAHLLFHLKIMEFSLRIRNCTSRRLAFIAILGPHFQRRQGLSNDLQIHCKNTRTRGVQIFTAGNTSFFHCMF